MTVRTNAWLKANFQERDPQDFHDDLVDSLSNGDWQQSKTQYYVDSNDAAASDANPGTDPAAPFATIEGAFAAPGLTSGDVIWVLPGHAEDIADAQIDLDVAGVFVIGIGSGKASPTLTFDHINASVNVQAIDITVSNVRLMASEPDVLIGIDVEAAVTGTMLNLIEFVEGETPGTDEFVWGIDVKAGCHDTTIQNLIANETAAATPVAVVKLTGASHRVKILDVWAYGSYSTAAILQDGAANLNLELGRLRLKVLDGEPGIEVAATTTGIIHDVKIASTGTAIADMIVAAAMEQFNCVGVTADGGAEAQIAVSPDSTSNLLGVDAGANLGTTASVTADADGSLLERAEFLADGIATAAIGQIQLVVAQSSSPLTSGPIFDYTGIIEIVNIVGLITTEIQDQATTTQLTLNPDAVGAYAICATVDIVDFLVNTLLSITGTAANGMAATDALGSIAPGQANAVIASSITAGELATVFGAASTGVIDWYLQWRPLSIGATCVAA